MKAIVYLLLFAVLCLVMIMVLSCQAIKTIEVFPTGTPSLIKLVIIAILALYEVLIRAIPTIGNYSIIAFIIDILKKLSDVLNVRTGNKKVNS